MRDEVKRILKLVQEGKLSAEDAAELIEAFEDPSEEPPAGSASVDSGAAEQAAEKTPWSQLVEAIERLGREVTSSVDWKHVAEQARTSTRKGVEAIRIGVEKVRSQDFEMPWNSNAETKDVELPLALPPGKMLRIINPSGSIKVEGGQAVGTVSARARIRASNVDEAHERALLYNLVIEESDQAVVIRQPDISGLEVQLAVKIDQGDLDITSESGDVTVVGTKGSCRVSARSGDVKVNDVSKSVEIKVQSGDVALYDAKADSIEIESKSGDVTLGNVSGPINARTASGEIRLKAVEASSLNIDCVSGNIEAELVGACSGTMSCRTVSGNISVSVPSGADCRVTLSTLRGESKSYVALVDDAKADQRITGQLGDGSGRLDVSSVTGDVSLRARS